MVSKRDPTRGGSPTCKFKLKSKVSKITGLVSQSRGGRTGTNFEFYYRVHKLPDVILIWLNVRWHRYRNSVFFMWKPKVFDITGIPRDFFSDVVV